MNKYKKINNFIISAFFCFCLTCCAIKERLESKKMPTLVDKPAELLWQDAEKFFKQKNYIQASASFEEIDKQHPYSKLAKKAQIMAAYSYYLNNDYKNSIFSIDRFLSLYPADKKVAYMLYLKGLCHYEQINEINLDQEPSNEAKKAYAELLIRFPNSKYAKDVKKKILLINDQLAAQEINIGRYYQKRNRHLAAIERFKVIVDKYNTTAQTPEALYRLTQSYLSLGITEEAKKSTAVLAYNYKKSNWYKLSYDLLKKYGHEINDKKG